MDYFVETIKSAHSGRGGGGGGGEWVSSHWPEMVLNSSIV